MTNNGNVGQDTMCACHALSYCLLPLPMLLLLLVLPNSTEQTAFSCKWECGAYIIALMGWYWRICIICQMVLAKKFHLHPLHSWARCQYVCRLHWRDFQSVDLHSWCVNPELAPPHKSTQLSHTIDYVRRCVWECLYVSFVCICRPRKRCWFARNWHKTAGDRSFIYCVCQLCVRASSFLSCSLTHLREHLYGD